MNINKLSILKKDIGLIRPYTLFFSTKDFVGALGPSLF